MGPYHVSKYPGTQLCIWETDINCCGCPCDINRKQPQSLHHGSGPSVSQHLTGRISSSWAKKCRGLFTISRKVKIKTKIMCPQYASIMNLCVYWSWQNALWRVTIRTGTGKWLFCWFQLLCLMLYPTFLPQVWNHTVNAETLCTSDISSILLSLHQISKATQSW